MWNGNNYFVDKNVPRRKTHVEKRGAKGSWVNEIKS